MERKNLWAPWRIKYIQSLSESSDCFICHNTENPQDDDKNLVLWRSNHCIVILNRFPYNNGHLLIAPARHIPDLEEATNEELLEPSKRKSRIHIVSCKSFRHYKPGRLCFVLICFNCSRSSVKL